MTVTERDAAADPQRIIEELQHRLDESAVQQAAATDDRAAAVAAVMRADVDHGVNTTLD
jgi:hypothetical protein